MWGVLSCVMLSLLLILLVLYYYRIRGNTLFSQRGRASRCVIPGRSAKSMKTGDMMKRDQRVAALIRNN